MEHFSKVPAKANKNDMVIKIKQTNGLCSDLIPFGMNLKLNRIPGHRMVLTQPMDDIGDDPLFIRAKTY